MCVSNVKYYSLSGIINSNISFPILKGKSSFSFQKVVILFLFVFSLNNCFSQLQSNETIYIGDNNYMYIGSGNYYFQSSNGKVITSRTNSISGKLIFTTSSSPIGGTNTNYIDGYGSVLSVVPITLPIGQSEIYAPAKISPLTARPIDAAYYRSNPFNVNTTIDQSVRQISALEYWNIKGSNSAIISLTWSNSSALENLVLSISDLIIVGYDGTKWTEISSVVDSNSILGGNSSLTSGSITSSAVVDFSTYSYFSLGAKGDSCPPLVTPSVATITWNGSWLPTLPTLADNVVINSTYSGGSFVCNSLVLNADVVLTDGQSAEIVNGVTGTGKFVMSSEASIVQRASNVTAPNIELTKRTRDVMHRYDYIYWGTPIAGDFFSQLANAKASSAVAANAFDYKYKYVNGSGGGWQTLTAIETGKGYITRIKSQSPFTNATNIDYINLKFSGIANNGDITIPITNNPSAPNGGTSHPLLANPYPSALDANKFLLENTDIDGVVYIWTSSTVNNGSGQLYSQADYIAYTLAGAVLPNDLPDTFNGKIASGQGFRVKALSQTGNVTFTNCMRLKQNNNQFYKSSQSAVLQEPKDRFKLNMIGNSAVFSQILIAYMPQATLNYDRLYDAGRNSVSTAQLYSIFEGDGRKLAINARPNFNVNDIVPLGVSKLDTTIENFTIRVTEKEGVFNSGAVSIFLHDKELGVYFDLANGDYTFSTNTTALDNRFEIVYQNGALNNNEFDNFSVYANIENQILSIKSSVLMTGVEVYDISGRKVLESKIENDSNFISRFNFAQSVYIAKVKLENDKVVNIKLLNR